MSIEAKLHLRLWLRVDQWDSAVLCLGMVYLHGIWDWAEERYLRGALSVGSIRGWVVYCLVVKSCGEALKKEVKLDDSGLSGLLME